MATQRRNGSTGKQNGRASDPPKQEAAGGPAPVGGAAPVSGTARDKAAASGYEPPRPEVARRPGNERENAFNVVNWLMEGAGGLMEEFRHNDLGLSEEFWIHAEITRREGLLAMRALVDSLIEKCDAADAAIAEQQVKRRGEISIEI